MSIRVQRYIAILSVILFLAKIYAWYLTHSVTILTDAMESTVNVIAGFIGLYSVILAAKPRDSNHPYGHGKVQFVTSAIEGALIMIAGLFIVYEAIAQLVEVKPLHKLDVGIWLILGTGIINFFVGRFAVSHGKKHRSLVVESAGQHLLSDAYATAGICIGILMVIFTKWVWLDSVVALCFAIIISVTGYRVLRRSMAGIMDEADEKLLKEVVDFLQKNRRDQWIDLHNLRVIQYGDILHIDAHMSLPWYYSIAQGAKEIDALEELVKTHFGSKVELFIHIDGCLSFQCQLCALKECPERKYTFVRQLEWDVQNVQTNAKHGETLS